MQIRISPRTRRSLLHAWWATCGAVVVLYVFLAALDVLDPADVEPITVLVLVLAVAWLAHSWRRLWMDERRA